MPTVQLRLNDIILDGLCHDELGPCFMASIVCLPSVKLKFNSVSKLTYKPVYTLALAFSEVVASMIVETVPPEWPVKFVLLDGGLQ